MTTETLDPTIRRYVDAVAAALADLPEAERTELLDDLTAHLAEYDGDEPLEVALGDPAAYAEELRASAGMAPPPPEPPARSLVELVVDATRPFASRPWVRSVRAFLPELRPAWWVLRGWLLVAVLAGSRASDIPVPRPSGSLLVGLLLLAAVLPVSVRLGRRGGRLDQVATVVGVILALVVVDGVQNHETRYVDQAYPSSVAEMWVYDETGTVSLGVRTGTRIDSTGRPFGEYPVRIDGTMRTVGACPDGRAWALCVQPFDGAPVTTVVQGPEVTGPTGVGATGPTGAQATGATAGVTGPRGPVVSAPETTTAPTGPTGPAAASGATGA